MNSSVQFESDFIPYKLATDVVLNGIAYSAHGATQTLTCSLIVGPYQKDILIIGDRTCHVRGSSGVTFPDPTPFTTMDIRYERAYGGIDIRSDSKMPCMYPRNHVGTGYVISSKPAVVDGLKLPNIEHPQDRLTPERLSVGHFMHWERQPVPAGFGWGCKLWRPRSGFAGVLPADRHTEQELRRLYTPLVPAHQRALYDQTALPDMDFRFFNGASPGLSVPYLYGDEEVRLINLSCDGDLAFRLPGESLRIGLDVGLGLQQPPVVLHTVQLRPEERELDMVWRAAAAYPGPDWLPEMKKMELGIQ